MKSLKAAVVAVFAMAALFTVAAATAGPDAGKQEAKADRKAAKDNLKMSWHIKQDRLRARGLQMKLEGKANGKVAKVAKGQYVELSREKTDKIFVVIAEFGNTRHPAFADRTAAGAPASDALVFDGPAHNSIPAPDRSVDNSTLWQDDYNHTHYQDMYFNRMARYYERQSSGRYSVDGAVTQWVKVPFNEARYGRDVCGDIVCNNTWFLIRDAMSIYVANELAAGKTIGQISDYLKTFDHWDRYDMDGDGNFDEPDGFIDHFQIVHAGGDQAAGDPQQGTDAIWSHRWYASLFGGGPGGFPGFNAGSGGGSGALPGGGFAAVLPDNPTGVWVGDYTIQPENGGLGVFAHEYGHDLGLPDLYDTSGNTGGAENSTAFWTLMSSGANIGDGGPEGIGDAPTDMGAWEKFQLGWLGCPDCPGGAFYGVANAGQKKEFKLGPNDAASKKDQAVFVVLPDKKKETHVGDPKTGSQFFWSTMGDDINTTMSRSVASGGTLTADVQYDMELHFDYAFIEASTNGGATFTPVPTNLSSPASADQSGINASGTGIDGTSGGNWVSLTAALPVGTNAVRVRYTTDGGVAERGFLIDNIAIGGTPIGTAETDEGWTFNGFTRTTGTEITFHFNAYVAESRMYDGYDTSLATAYNFGFLNTKPDWVEHYPYQDGLLVNYWDDSFGDNSVGDHPGGGLILPVDAHPSHEHWSNGQYMRQRIQAYDSTFGLERTDPITLNLNSSPTTIASKPAVPVFNDLLNWWSAGDGHTAASHGRFQPGWTGVNVPKTGTTIRVKSVSAQGKFMQIQVAPAN